MGAACRISKRAVCALAICIASDAATAGQLPSGGKFIVGSGAIANGRRALTIDQYSRVGIVDWTSFSVGKNNHVIIDNGHGATLDRVIGGNLSLIAGAVHSTGTFYLINSAGIVVSNTGRVLTGGSFVASSLSSNGSDNQNTKRPEKRSHGLVIAGQLRSNSSVALRGGHADVSGDIFAVGHVSVSSEGRTDLSGVIAAYGRNGRGGLVETSGRELEIDGRISTGIGGRWLVDPTDLTVDANAAQTIDNALNGGTDVELQTTATGASGPGNQSSGPGDINIDSGISWSTSASLTLDSYHSIFLDGSILTSVGTGANLKLVTDDGGVGGTLEFQNAIYIDGTLDLDSGGTVTQGNAIAAGILTGSSIGAVQLKSQYNEFGEVGQFTTDNADFSVSAYQGLNIIGNISVGTAELTLRTTGRSTNGTNIALDAELAGATVTLYSTGIVSEGANGLIEANDLNGKVRGNDPSTLDANNRIAVIRSFSARGNLSIADAMSLTVVGNVYGSSVTISTNGADDNLYDKGIISGATAVALTSSGSLLAIDRTVSSNSVSLNSSGGISEGSDGRIYADELFGSSKGTVDLTESQHSDFYYNDIRNLMTFTTDGSAFLLSTLDDLLVVDPISTGASALSLETKDGDLKIDAPISGSKITLDSGNAIEQNAAGVVTATILDGNATGPVALNARNSVVELGSFSTVNHSFLFRDDASLTVTGVLYTGSGSLSLETAGLGHDLDIMNEIDAIGTITLDAGGSANEGANGAIVANVLNVTADTGIDMTSSHNNINRLGKDVTKSGSNKINL